MESHFVGEGEGRLSLLFHALLRFAYDEKRQLASFCRRLFTLVSTQNKREQSSKSGREKWVRSFPF